jgi:hypothetical protein
LNYYEDPALAGLLTPGIFFAPGKDLDIYEVAEILYKVGQLPLAKVDLLRKLIAKGRSAEIDDSLQSAFMAGGLAQGVRLVSLRCLWNELTVDYLSDLATNHWQHEYTQKQTASGVIAEASLPSDQIEIGVEIPLADIFGHTKVNAVQTPMQTILSDVIGSSILPAAGNAVAWGHDLIHRLLAETADLDTDSLGSGAGFGGFDFQLGVPRENFEAAVRKIATLLAEDFGVPDSTTFGWYQPYDEWAEATEDETPELTSLPETPLPEQGSITVGSLRAN